MKAFLLFVFLMLSPPTNAEEYVSFLGTALKQTYLPNAEQDGPLGHVCVDAVYRWTIKIEKVISGKINGRIVKAARIQHAKYIFAHENQALYVLSRIESEAKRKLLGADYWLEEYAAPKTLYCISPGNDYGIEGNEFIALDDGSQACYIKHGEH
ncbi:MAG: hypothetical protein ABJA62_10475 [Luteimonas sp.]